MPNLPIQATHLKYLIINSMELLGTGYKSKDLAGMLYDINESDFQRRNQMVEIEGHTDDIPIHTLAYPSNWELSSDRAVAIVKRLVQQGVKKQELKAVAYADSRPKIALSTAQDISAARAENRRAVIYIRRP